MRTQDRLPPRLDAFGMFDGEPGERRAGAANAAGHSDRRGGALRAERARAVHGGRDAADHPQYLPATVSMSAFGDQPPQDTPHSVNVITEDAPQPRGEDGQRGLELSAVRDHPRSAGAGGRASAAARVPGQRRPEYAHRRHEHHWPDRLRGRGF